MKVRDVSPRGGVGSVPPSAGPLDGGIMGASFHPYLTLGLDTPVPGGPGKPPTRADAGPSCLAEPAPPAPVTKVSPGRHRPVTGPGSAERGPGQLCPAPDSLPYSYPGTYSYCRTPRMFLPRACRRTRR